MIACNTDRVRKTLTVSTLCIVDTVWSWVVTLCNPAYMTIYIYDIQYRILCILYMYMYMYNIGYCIPTLLIPTID